MAIRILRNSTEEINAAINASCEMIYDIEDLLTRGPKQLEAYSALLKILKDMKRGCPIQDSVNRNAVQGCPPSLSANEACEKMTCQACWKEYVKSFVERAKEKRK